MSASTNIDNKQKNKNIYAVATTLIVIVAIVVFGMLGCVRDKARKRIGHDNLLQAQEAYAKGNIEEALEYAIGADYDYEGTELSPESATTHALLFLLYYMAGLENESLEKIKTIEQAELPLISNSSRSNYYLLSAYLYATVERDSTLAFAYTDSLKNFHAIANPTDTAMSYLDINNIVEIYTAVGDTTTSWQLIRQMDANPVEPASKYSHQLNINKARLYDLAGKTDSAVKYAHKVLGVNFNENLDAYNRALAYSVLMKADSLNGNLTGYAAHRDSLDHIKYEIQGNRKKYLIATIQGRDKAAALLKDIKLQKSRTVFWIVSTCCIFLLIIALIVWKYRERRANHRIAVLECQRLAAEVRSSQLRCEHLASEVRTRNDELTASINERDELTRQLRKAMANVATISPIEHLRLRLNQDYPDFVSMLNKRFPDISSNDRLILGAIKAGLSPKETAAALNISHSSLLTARYRLRKKLNLDQNLDLDDFVISL